MNNKQLRFRVGAALGLACWLSLGGPMPARAAAPFGVPVRLSFKFFLNGSGNRPATGELNTDTEIQTQVDRGNQILSSWTSELRIYNYEIVDVSGHSEWYNGDTDDRDAIRTAALADKTGFAWRDNAVNIYITANTGCSARADFPPDNNIVIICQSIFDTTVMHEIGHILNLYHTHQGESSGCTNCSASCTAGNSDNCSDTLPDSQCWNQNQISQNAYGANYAALTASQQYNVNMVWSNLMSYHNGDFRSMISSCQLDRMSSQASDDQTWLLSKRPVYVDPSNGGSQNGTFTQPYSSIQGAINSGTLNGRVLVLDQGTHADPTSVITTTTDVVPRKGTATIQEYMPPYDLPSNLEDSSNPQVKAAIIRAQQADRKKDISGVITNLLAAESFATGHERDAIRLEIAQRYRDNKEYEEAAVWFQRVADEADQPGLRKRSGEKAVAARKEHERRQQEKEKTKSNDNQK